MTLDEAKALVEKSYAVGVKWRAIYGWSVTLGTLLDERYPGLNGFPIFTALKPVGSTIFQYSRILNTGYNANFLLDVLEDVERAFSRKMPGNEEVPPKC